jgi:hypothetical protein
MVVSVVVSAYKHLQISITANMETHVIRGFGTFLALRDGFTEWYKTCRLSPNSNFEDFYLKGVAS